MGPGWKAYHLLLSKSSPAGTVLKATFFRDYENPKLSFLGAAFDLTVPEGLHLGSHRDSFFYKPLLSLTSKMTITNFTNKLDQINEQNGKRIVSEIALLVT
jgi:hypothetical protein